jgi:hypothetical protein
MTLPCCFTPVFHSRIPPMYLWPEFEKNPKHNGACIAEPWRLFCAKRPEMRGASQAGLRVVIDALAGYDVWGAFPTGRGSARFCRVIPYAECGLLAIWIDSVMNPRER